MIRYINFEIMKILQVPWCSRLCLELNVTFLLFWSLFLRLTENLQIQWFSLFKSKMCSPQRFCASKRLWSAWGAQTYHIFKLIQNIYNLTNFHIFEFRNPKTKMFGENNTVDKPSQLWKHNPEEDKNSLLFSSFIESIKNFPFICCLLNCCKK